MSVRALSRSFFVLCSSFVILALAASAQHPRTGPQNTDWSAYNGGLDGDHYSRLSQITRANVTRLKQAWVYDTGEPGGIQTNPLIVDGVLYGFTPTQKVIALDAATCALK
jgi:glucose dehydrogenase